MATQAHCAYAFECLAASFEHRQPLSLGQVEDLWSQYHDLKADNNDEVEDEDAESHGNEGAGDADMTDAEEPAPAPTHTTSAKPAAISRLLHRSRGGSESSSQSSLPSTRSTASSTPSGSSGTEDTPATSRSSLFSLGRRRRNTSQQRYPLFVTWNVVNRSGHKTLRGCIGTFEAQDLESGLRSYALTRKLTPDSHPRSAFEDIRFPPIPPSLLPSLSTHITLLHNFSAPTSDPLDWDLGHHGLRISFTLSSHRRHGATYLPDVPREQGWTKEETLISLMRKAGWNGSSSGWNRIWREGKGELIR
ncbi:hypothetical protein KC355_g16622, partial [Hortaea werneckii]